MVDLSVKPFDVSNTYAAYNRDNVYKCTPENILQTISEILKQKPNERVLIEVDNTIGLSNDVIKYLTSNIDVRVIGGLTEEFAKSHRHSDAMDHLREKATYSKEELTEINAKFDEIERNIDPNWNEYQKALYLYEYVKTNITYRVNRQIGPNGKWLDEAGNSYRTRTWDSLIGLTNGLSTCSGFSHIYTELCTRQGIKCVQVGGKYVSNGEGDHAWNIVTINGNNFIVDAIWDAQEYENGKDVTTGFGIKDVSHYSPRSYHDMHKNISSIDPNWVSVNAKKVSEKIPKEQNAQKKVENFLKKRELDRQRMMYLRGEQLNKNQGGITL